MLSSDSSDDDIYRAAPVKKEAEKKIEDRKREERRDVVSDYESPCAR